MRPGQPTGRGSAADHSSVGPPFDASAQTEEVFKQYPPWLDFFLRHWLKEPTSARMNYAAEPGEPNEPGGWQQNPHDTSYNTALAMLHNMPQAIQWEDQGPAGARWHGYSTTKGGQPLKAPWHPTEWRQEQALLQQAINHIMGINP
jgi:hypothetical protein